MPFVQAKCTNCGGILEVDNTKDAAICKFCGTPFVVEKAINNYTSTNYIAANNVNIYHVTSLNNSDIEHKINNAYSLIEINEIGKAHNAFKQLTKDYSNDIRGWLGSLTILVDYGFFDESMLMNVRGSKLNEIRMLNVFQHICQICQKLSVDFDQKYWADKLYNSIINGYCFFRYREHHPIDFEKSFSGVFTHNQIADLQKKGASNAEALKLVYRECTSRSISYGKERFKDIYDIDIGWAEQIISILGVTALCSDWDPQDGAGWYTTQKIIRPFQIDDSIISLRKKYGVCQHCGGRLKGMFSKTCIQCGQPKDY